MSNPIVVSGSGGGSVLPGVVIRQAVPSKVESCGNENQPKSTPDFEAMLLRAWQMAEETYGPEDLATGAALASLAEYYQSRGQTVEAEACDRRLRGILDRFLSSVA